MRQTMPEFSFKTYFIEAETTREEIHDYLEQNISEYKKTLVYASDVEALRKSVSWGLSYFRIFSHCSRASGLIGFDVTDGQRSQYRKSQQS